MVLEVELVVKVVLWRPALLGKVMMGVLIVAVLTVAVEAVEVQALLVFLLVLFPIALQAVEVEQAYVQPLQAIPYFMPEAGAALVAIPPLVLLMVV